MSVLKGSLGSLRRASGRAVRPVLPTLHSPDGNAQEDSRKVTTGTLPMTYEQSRLAAQRGGAIVIGVDEAGRGPLAGPVVAAACAVLDPTGDPPVLGVDDSKKVDEEDRERLYEELMRNPGLVFGVSKVDEGVIDEINILQATFRGMQEATADLVAKLPKSMGVAHVAVDGPHVPPGLKASYGTLATGVVGGDARVYSIAAASIVAKVTRDRLMREHDRAYPAYGFAKHKGYGVAGRLLCVAVRQRRLAPSAVRPSVAAHVDAIRKHGPCPIHRRTFAPVKHWFPAGDAAAPAATAATAASTAPPRKVRAPPRDRSAAPAGESRAVPEAAAVLPADSGRSTRSRSSRSGGASPQPAAAAAPAQAAPSESADRKRRRAQK